MNGVRVMVDICIVAGDVSAGRVVALSLSHFLSVIFYSELFSTIVFVFTYLIALGYGHI